MRKSILVIDTPECCNECEMCEETDRNHCVCRVSLDEIGLFNKTIEDDSAKPDWCPLRDLPDKKPCMAMGKWLNFNCGYNSCVDEILKGSDKG